MDSILILFLFLLLAKTGFEIILNRLNARHVMANQGPIPDTFQGIMDQEEYDKAGQYTLAKLKFGQWETLFDSLVLAVILATGWLAWLYHTLTARLGEGVWGQSLVLFVIGIVLSLPGIPFEYYNQFSLEERFGFNKSSKGLWISDKLKEMLVSAVLFIPLLAGLLALVRWLPATWWFFGFLVFFGFSLLMMVLYPMWIVPLFNKLEPLQAGELKTRLMDLADRTGFKAQTIQVIDGSKRSAHSNAYFTGFGKFRRIVLFDTLIDQLESEELEAVLAHEIGHYRMGHVPKMLGLSAISGLLGFWVLFLLASSDWFLPAFGFNADTGIAAAFLLFGLVSGVLTFWVSPLMSKWSRKHEYEADAFARDALDRASPLVGALRRLSKKNLSNLTPHPLYSAWYYSHPTLIEREKAMTQL